MHLIETKTTGLPEFTEPSLFNISPTKIGGLACATLLYGAALRTIAPYSLNSTKKIVCFMGAEALITIGLHFFPIHNLVMNHFGKVNPLTTVLSTKSPIFQTEKETKTIKDWVEENKVSLSKRVYALENQNFFISRVSRVAFFALALPTAGYLFRKAISTLSSDKLAYSFITTYYVTRQLQQSFFQHLGSNDQSKIINLSNVFSDAEKITPSAKARRIAFLQQAIKEQIENKNFPVEEISHPNQDSSNYQTIRKISQIGIAAILIYSFYQAILLKNQVPSLSRGTTKKLKIANLALNVFGIIIFKNLITKTAEVAFPNHVW